MRELPIRAGADCSTILQNLQRLRAAPAGDHGRRARRSCLASSRVASVYLNRPAYETLYVGLERADVNQIGLVLGEAGIGFDVASDGTTVLVPAGTTAQARMLLAEKGLPTSANAGYELFDNVGSLGLTSFMQQITRVRALEGEIARTIQSIQGIKAARVHIVMSERANFRRDEQKPSASVVIRASGTDGAQERHVDPLSGRRRRTRPERRGRDGARFQRHAACRRRRSQQHQRQPLDRRRAHRRDARSRTISAARWRPISGRTISAPASRPT